MSWLSKWWKNGGRELVQVVVATKLESKGKEKALERLRKMVAMLDRMDLDGLRQELYGIIRHVEGM